MSEIMRSMIQGKIHRATVTGADLHYVGSITIDEDLLDAANIAPGQQVDIADVNNGNRLSTYTIAGPRGSGVIQRQRMRRQAPKPSPWILEPGSRP